jgi:hypothetical protein
MGALDKKQRRQMRCIRLKNGNSVPDTTKSWGFILYPPTGAYS